MNNNVKPKWKFVGGQLCLDFINSVDGRIEQRVKNTIVSTIRKDKLESYEDLVDWGKTIGVLKEATAKNLIHIASQKGKITDQVFERAIILRESLFRILKHIIENQEPSEEDMEILNSECVVAREWQKLVYSSNKFSWNFESVDDEPDCMIWQIALSGAEFLLSDQLHRVRQCPGENCGWLFLDTSKNDSRQWCDMKDCGNLAKVRRYRERQR